MEPVVTPVDAIQPASPNEALELEWGELERFVAALEAIPFDAWTLPVRGRGWDVHALVAHVAGSYAAQASFGELRRQTAPRVVRFYRMEGESLGETIARIQIGDRRNHSPAQMIAELREVGPRAIEHRTVVFRPLQLVGRALAGNRRLPVIPFAPFQAVRDLWFHRLDLTEATSTEFSADRQHDGRILEQLIRLVAPQGAEALGERTVDLIVSGAAGGRWRFGEQSEPAAVVEMGPVVFAKLIGKQHSAAGIRERSRVDGDVRTAMSLLSAIRSDG
jgi:uncharacterized protein (TIGR03083 family)